MSIDPRVVAREWIGRALLEQHVPPSIALVLSEDMQFALDECGVPVEECIRWIHSELFEPYISAWAHHCAWYMEFQQKNCRREAPPFDLA